MSKCPCGTEKNYSECCEPFILGEKKPPSAEALMRSRYSAFAKNKLDYIKNSHHKSTQKDLDMESVKAWAVNSTWLGLEILNTEKGTKEDHEGIVEFRCSFILNEKTSTHHELSTFIKENGDWFFVDGKLKNKTITRSTPKIGRNDPCACGSGKKSKKCCLR